MKQSELTYWMALAHADRMFTRRKNEILARVHELSTGQDTPLLSTFFEAGDEGWRTTYGLTADEVTLMSEARQALPNHAFMLERLQEQGYELTTIFSPDYPTTLKQHLKYNSPLLLYSKGNRELLKQRMVAVVGARSASPVAIQFTDGIARAMAQQGRVVVSGYAKGVDRQALDSALAGGGSSIVVLPQGITTFGTGFSSLHRWIAQGRVLVLSYFAPQAPWSTGFAMARNHVVYGLADAIYVAESNNKGGTYTGVTDGLRQGREIYVRQPSSDEKNANQQLIDMGAVAVDAQGTPIAVPAKTAVNEYPSIDFGAATDDSQ